MSDDRKLLENAAKAAGLAVSYCDEWDGLGLDYGVGWLEEWNPLTDDGDALRLAVKLRFDVDCTWTGQTVVFLYDMPFDLEPFSEAHGADPGAATRRAIVRAAAYVGEQMP